MEWAFLRGCLSHPRKRTSIGATVMSALGQEQTLVLKASAEAA
jgi:hypothetical protein